MIVSKKKALISAIMMSSLGLSSTVFAAQSLSDDAAQVKAQTGTSSAVRVEVDQPAPANAAGQARFELKDISVSGDNQSVSQTAMKRIASRYTGRLVTLNDLNAMTKEITVYLRSHGYPAAAAYAPAQRIQNGVLSIKILPGLYGSVKIDNKSKLQDSVVERITRGLKSGKAITTNGLESVLYRLNDLGAVKATGLLSPGGQTGTSDLTLHIEDAKNVRATLYAENHGTKAAGHYRYGLIDDVYNVDHHGEHLNISGLISNDHMHNYSASFDLPYGTTATKAGISVGRSDYMLGSQFKNINAVGQSDNISLYAETPLLRTTGRSRYLRYGFDYRRLKDELRTYSYDVKRRSQTGHIGYAETIRTGKNVLDTAVTVSHEQMTMVSDYAKQNAMYSHAKGRFTKGVIDMTSVQGFNRRWDLLVRAQGQLASRNLDSSEQFYLGGANGVRAYPQGEGAGDVGGLASAELRYHTSVPGLTLCSFYDNGYSRGSKDGTYPSMHLSGWGLGMSYTRPDDYFLRLDYARRIGLDKNATDDAASNHRLWFMAGKIW